MAKSSKQPTANLRFKRSRKQALPPLTSKKDKRIKANPAKQARNNSYSPPEYYEDHKFTCRDCGVEQVWTAEQQRWWYEVARAPVQSTAIRCRTCRAKVRRQKLAQKQHMEEMALKKGGKPTVPERKQRRTRPLAE